MGSFKINWDVGFNRATDNFGMGIVIRDLDGKELFLSCIVMEGDAQIIVKGINTFERNWCKYVHIIEDIWWMLQSFHGWSS